MESRLPESERLRLNFAARCLTIVEGTNKLRECETRSVQTSQIDFLGRAARVCRVQRRQTRDLLKKPEWNSEKIPSHKVGLY